MNTTPPTYERAPKSRWARIADLFVGVIMFLSWSFLLHDWLVTGKPKSTIPVLLVCPAAVVWMILDVWPNSFGKWDFVARHFAMLLVLLSVTFLLFG